MSLTVVGSIAFDRVKTPFGERERMLGGAATHFALAASFFDDVRVVGPVGDDFADEDLRVLQARGTNTDDVERVAGGEAVFWHGEYGWDLNSPETRDTVQAAREIHAMGPSVVVAKQGEYGAALLARDTFFALPAYPLETVVDPTGAGDTFAGGFVGYLAARRGELGDEALRRAM